MNNLERLILYYLAGRVFIPAPRYLIYNATWRCDLFCRHCGVWEAKKRGELSPENLEKIINRKFFSKIDTVWLTGGEPTLRPDLNRLARIFRLRLPAMRILGIASNGSATERVISRLEEILSELDPDRHGLFIQLSLDGIGEVEDRIRGKQGVFAGLSQTVKEIDLLKKKYPERKIELGFNCVIQRQNVAQLNEIKEFAVSKGAGLTFNVIEITDQGYNNKQREEELAFHQEEKGEAKRFLRKLISGSEPGFRYHYRSILSVLDGKTRNRRCLSLYSTLVIDSDGSWLPCPLCSEWMRVNFLEMDPGKFWKGKEARALRRKAAQELCPSCMLSCSVGDSLSLREFFSGGF